MPYEKDVIYRPGRYDHQRTDRQFSGGPAGKLEFMPGVIGALREITGNTDFRLVMVSNRRWLRDCRFSYGRFYASANIDVEGVGK